VNFTDASGDGLTACHRTRTLELQILKRIRRIWGRILPSRFAHKGSNWSHLHWTRSSQPSGELQAQQVSTFEIDTLTPDVLDHR
jgi:hypothetical protein